MSDIECRGLVKAYGSTRVVHGFDLKVQAHEFVVFLGPSGCGKSTILRMIAGLEGISGGDLLIGGRRVNDVAPQDRNIAMVFQNYALYPHMSVRENITFGLRRSGLPAAELERRVQEVTRMLNLEDYLQRKPAQLSGGQQQRVAIARAMIKTPEVFLFDEPLSNLDAKLRHHMRVQIARLHQQLRTTTIYVTHDQLEAMTLADRIVLLKDGKVEQIGTPREIYERPRTRFVAGFVGTPPINFIDMQVHLDGASAWLVAGEQRLPLDASQFQVKDGQYVAVGLRPSSLRQVEAGGQQATVEGQVNLVEFLGSETLLTITFAGVEVGALVSGQGRVAEGDRVGFTFSQSDLQIFDAASGLSLRSGG